MTLLLDVKRGGALPGLPDKHFIGGAWRHSVGGGMMESFDPGRASPHAIFSAGSATSKSGIGREKGLIAVSTYCKTKAVTMRI